MTNTTIHTTRNLILLTPTLGIIIFAVLYVVATFFYPGGSNADNTTTGFDWINNYWCDLTGKIAKNGALNTARPLALTAMFCLCSSLSIFWFNVPKLFMNNKFNQAIRYAGIASMITTVFLFTGYHDAVINIAGTLGLIAFTGVFIGLYKNNVIRLFGFGVFCVGLMLFNYYIYETNFLLSSLPIIQKVTFAISLLWFCLMDIHLYQKFSDSNQMTIRTIKQHPKSSKVNKLEPIK